MGITALGLLVSLALGWSHAHQVVKEDQRKPTALEAFDVAFRQQYAKARASTLSRLDPIIVVYHDALVLMHAGKREEVDVIPRRYHDLKAIAHMPLSLFVALAPREQGPLDDEAIEDLKRLRASIELVREAIGDSGFSAEQLKRAQTIVERSSRLLDEVIAAGRYAKQDLLDFTSAMAPLVMANGRDAAIAQIDAYHAQVSAWRRTLGPEAWSQLRVVVLGGQMPRKGNVAARYFAKCLGIEGESRRLVYAEQSSGPPSALNLLATHQLDSEIGAAFFNDPERMERDLLGDAAAEYLKTFDVSAP
jgi:hypothetical protein